MFQSTLSEKLISVKSGTICPQCASDLKQCPGRQRNPRILAVRGAAWQRATPSASEEQVGRRAVRQDYVIAWRQKAGDDVFDEDVAAFSISPVLVVVGNDALV